MSSPSIRSFAIVRRAAPQSGWLCFSCCMVSVVAQSKQHGWLFSLRRGPYFGSGIIARGCMVPFVASSRQAGHGVSVALANAVPLSSIFWPFIVRA